MLKAQEFLFYIMLLLLVHLNGLTQPVFDEIVDQELYTSQRSIVNGIAWTNSVKYMGNKFYGSSQWKSGEVKFNGKLYLGLQINYDILEDKLILFDGKSGEEKYIEINKKLIEMFRFQDDNITHTFVNTELIPTKGKEFYEEVYTGPCSFYIKHKKTIKKEIGPVYMGKLYDGNIHYLTNNTGVHQFKNKKTILQILGNSIELKKYIRKENLKINRKHPNDIVRLLVYNESLINDGGI
jgi:hypothetical protein